MNPSSADLDALVVGAGVSGLYMLHRLRGLGLNVTVVEAGADVGGTWYWNRYPGARCDVPSIEYSYSFDEALQQDWDWTEVMSGQPEILDYVNHVADRFDLRRDIRFNTRIEACHFDPAERRWRAITESGEELRARFCIMATGCLSMPNTPVIDGAEDFQGPVYHTGGWPHEGVDFSGLSVGLIGTGSSGVQSIPVIAERAAQLTVFQRTPVYAMPAHNRPLTADYIKDVKAHYGEIRKTQRESITGIVGYVFGFGGSGDGMPTQAILESTPEERLAALDEKGFDGLHRYADINLDPKANELGCEMFREQLRRIIDDPDTAEKLMPYGYPLGCKRLVIGTHYFEAFNRNNVSVVDLRRGGIERITATGIQTEQGQFEFDALVYATGFDAMTGALARIDIRGRDGQTLQDRWTAGPRSYLGLQVHGFPNLFTITGPGSPSVLSNMMVSIEQHVEWISDCIAHMNDHQLRSIEPTPEAEEAWIAHVYDVAKGTMFTAPNCNSWYLGANIPGKPRIFMPYIGGVGAYRKKCDEIAANDYDGFVLSA